MNKETVKKLLSSGSGEDQRLGLEYLQYLEDQEIEEIVYYYASKEDIHQSPLLGYPNNTGMTGFIQLPDSILLLGVGTIVRYSLADAKRHFTSYKRLNKNLTLWQENQLIQQNQDK